jgi:AraC-like DNA-binding protein
VKGIAQAAAVCGLAIAVGIALGVLGFGFHGLGAGSRAGTDPTTIVMVFGFAVWIISTLMIGQALPRRRRPAMISGMGRSDRVTLTMDLRNRVIAKYIGDALPSIRDVAREVGCSYGTVHRIVTEAGVVRPRGITNRSLSRTRRQAVNA